MSFMRYGYPLRHFKGETKSYVFPTIFKGKEYIEDYDDTYKDNASFIELIGRYVEEVTKDEKYARKIIEILAKKLRVEYKLRKKPLTFEQQTKLMEKRMKKFRESKEGKRFYKKFGDKK